MEIHTISIQKIITIIKIIITKTINSIRIINLIELIPINEVIKEIKVQIVHLQVIGVLLIALKRYFLIFE